MAETNQNPIVLDVLPGGSEVSVNIPVDIYYRLQKMIFEAFPFKDLNHFHEILAKIHAGTADSDPLSYHLHTILWLADQIEIEAKKKGIIVKKEFDPVSGKVKE